MCAPSTTLLDMQAMKGRAVEHVRFRIVGEFADVSRLAVQLVMRQEAFKYLKDHSASFDTKVLFSESPPGSARQISAVMGPQAFVKAAHTRSLQVTRFKDVREQSLRDEYKELLSEFPASTLEKVGKEQMKSPLGRGRAVSQLVSLHAGEVVEVDPSRTTWHLRRKPCSSTVWREDGQWATGRHHQSKTSTAVLP